MEEYKQRKITSKIMEENDSRKKKKNLEDLLMLTF